MHEWPLILFTLLLQASVGMLVISTIFLFVSHAHKTHDIKHRMSQVTLCVSFSLSMLGLFASVFHLGNPYHMVYTLMNPFTSWMSREIWVTGLYMGILFLGVLCVIFKRRLTLFTALSLCSGLVLMYVMCIVYIDSRFPLWATPATYFTFCASTLNLGAIVTFITFSPMALRHTRREYWIPLVGLVTGLLVIGALFGLIAASLLWAISFVPSMLSIGQFSIPDKLIFWHFLRLTLLCIAILLVGWLCFNMKKNRKIIVLFIFFSALCVIVSEGIGRGLFYELSSSFYTTIPG